MEQPRPATPAPGEQQATPARPRGPRKPYARPAVISETRLETRAGTPLPPNSNPLNTPNDYGL